MKNNNINGRKPYHVPTATDGEPAGSSPAKVRRIKRELANSLRQQNGLCNAFRKRDGKLCQLPAGKGTNHVGTGRCKFHGGASQGPPLGSENALKHGLTRGSLLPFYRPSHQWIEEQIEKDFGKEIDPKALHSMLWDEIKYCVKSLAVLDQEFRQLLEIPTAMLIRQPELSHYREVYERQRSLWFNRYTRLLHQLPEVLGKMTEVGLVPDDIEENAVLLGHDGDVPLVIVGDGARPEDTLAAIRRQLGLESSDATMAGPESKPA